MKFLLCLFLLFVSSMPVVAQSNDTTVRGVVGGSTQIPDATPEQIEESFQVADSCKTYSYTNTHYDCDCVGMKFLDLRRKEGDKVIAATLISKAQLKCPNAPAMAGVIYERCLTWAPMERGEDYEEFCSCYGSEFAKIYAKYPSDNQLVREYQMTRALTGCNVNSVNRQKQDMQKMVKKLKADGIYDDLLPGAAMIENPINPK